MDEWRDTVEGGEEKITLNERDVREGGSQE